MTLAEKIYHALAEKDMTRHELAKVIGETPMNTIHGITSATYLYPDIYEYDKKKGNGKAIVIGRLCNYKGKKYEN